MSRSSKTISLACRIIFVSSQDRQPGWEKSSTRMDILIFAFLCGCVPGANVTD